uniref:Uncharacterized protein n=1 Tax=Oncorhynchus tshawytscha TaxID=74940 RepID=A0AAZ3PT88_ONCTS
MEFQLLYALVWKMEVTASVCRACHCCDWIRHHYGHLSAEYLSLLDQMGGDITKQNAPVLFPTSLYRHIDDAEVEDKVRFRKEVIYKITKLFDGNMKSVTWDKKNLDDFLKILEKQFENLNSCWFWKHHKSRECPTLMTKFDDKMCPKDGPQRLPVQVSVAQQDPWRSDARKILSPSWSTKQRS